MKQNNYSQKNSNQLPKKLYHSKLINHSKKLHPILKDPGLPPKMAKKQLKLDKVDFYNSDDSLSFKSKQEDALEVREKTKERRKMIYFSRGSND